MVVLFVYFYRNSLVIIISVRIQENAQADINSPCENIRPNQHNYLYEEEGHVQDPADFKS